MKAQGILPLPIITAFTRNYKSSAYLVFYSNNRISRSREKPKYNESMFKGKGENHNWHPMGVRGSFSIEFSKSL